MSVFKYIDKGLTLISLGVIRVYQHTLSPDKGPLRFWLGGTICNHEPHCSEFSKMCFKRYGFIRGCHYTMERVSQCTGGNELSYDPPTYRVVFFSGSPIGIPFLEKLVEDKRYDVVGVVTQPPVPSGRGMKIKANPVEVKAKELGDIPVATPESLRKKSKKYGEQAKQFETWFKDCTPDIAVVVAYGKILPLETLELPRFGTINVHGSILPKYRGASPLQSVFLADHNASGVTIMKMSEGMDEGSILSTHSMPIQLDWTVKTLIDKLRNDAPAYLNDTMRDYVKGRIDPLPQDETEVTYCSKIEKEEGLVDMYANTLEILYKKYQAYALWPKIYTELQGKRIVIEDIQVDPITYEKNKDTPLLSKDNEVNPSVISLLVKPEGKKSMDWDSFVRGYLS